MILASALLEKLQNFVKRWRPNQPNHSIPANLVYSMQAQDVQTVIVDGNIVMRERQILTIDKSEVIGRVQASLDRLQQRQPSRRIQTYKS